MSSHKGGENRYIKYKMLTYKKQSEKQQSKTRTTMG